MYTGREPSKSIETLLPDAIYNAGVAVRAVSVCCFMRILIVSTPRSGNTWFRHLLSGALGLAEFAVHRESDLDWAELPKDCIVQMHWRFKPDVLRLCHDFGFQPVLIVRHPLDVLISILHFCTFEPATRFWLDGEAGNESSIHGKDPADPAFATYATGPRAAALLAVSVEWMLQRVERVPHIRYEDLVARPQAELEAFLKQLPAKSIRPLTEVIDANTLEKARPTANNRHFWQGKPGMWSQLIDRDLATRIQHAHTGVFESLGYGIDDAWNPAPDDIRILWSALT